ncbi:MAG: hypothetical protein K9I85_07155 [Saprospiraceae bacterium]|nr:hypothetical protein [Saprospiraceae bacterium]
MNRDFSDPAPVYMCTGGYGQVADGNSMARSTFLIHPFMQQSEWVVLDDRIFKTVTA